MNGHVQTDETRLLLAGGEHRVAPVQVRVRRGEIGAGVRAAALLAGERAAGDEPGERMRIVRAAARSVAASRSRPACRHIALRVSREGGAGDGVRRARRRVRVRARGSSSAASAARRPKTKHSESEFEASRLAPCRPVQAHSPTA